VVEFKKVIKMHWGTKIIIEKLSPEKFKLVAG